MTYNTREVIEAKRRLHDHAAELKRSGGPHQQTLVDDLNTLLHAHAQAIIKINQLTPVAGAASTAGDSLVDIKAQTKTGTGGSIGATD